MFFKFFDHIYSQISLQKGDANLYFHQWDLIITISLQLLTTLGCSFRFLTLIPNIMHAHIKNKHNKATQQYKFIKSKGCTSSKEPACQCRRLKRQRFSPWVEKIPWRRAWKPTPVFLPGEFHGQRRPAGYSPQGCTELDMTQVTQHTHTKGAKPLSFTLFFLLTLYSMSIPRRTSDKVCLWTCFQNMHLCI